MAIVPPSPTLPESRRLSIRLPHWGWFLLSAIVMVVAFVGLSVWLPYHREQNVTQEIKRWGGTVGTETGGGEWLRQLAGSGLVYLNGLTGLKVLRFTNTQVTDAGIAELQRAVPDLSVKK